MHWALSQSFVRKKKLRLIMQLLNNEVTREMVKVFTRGQMDQDMKVTTKMTREMEKVCKLG